MGYPPQSLFRVPRRRPPCTLHPGFAHLRGAAVTNQRLELRSYGGHDLRC